MPDDLYARALAKLDGIVPTMVLIGTEEDDEELSMALSLLRALLVERQAAISLRADGTWEEYEAAEKVSDAELREFAGDPDAK